MSFPDDPTVLTVPKDFAAHVLAGSVHDDPRVATSTLLTFARNFYLQWFDEEHQVEITGFNEAGRDAVRRVEENLSSGKGSHERLLVSHYLTIAEILDEHAATSDQLDPGEAQAEVFDGVHELLNRISNWAHERGLEELGREGRKTYEQLGRAIATL